MNEVTSIRRDDTTGFPFVIPMITEIMRVNNVPEWLVPVSPYGIIPDVAMEHAYAIPLRTKGRISKEAEKALDWAKESAGVDKRNKTVMLMMVLGMMNPDEEHSNVTVVCQPVEQQFIHLSPMRLDALDRIHVHPQSGMSQFAFIKAAKTGIWPYDGIHYPQIYSFTDLMNMYEDNVYG